MLRIPLLLATLSGLEAFKQASHESFDVMAHGSSSSETSHRHGRKWKPITVSDVVTIQLTKDGRPKVMIGTHCMSSGVVHHGHVSEPISLNKTIKYDSSQMEHLKAAQKYSKTLLSANIHHKHGHGRTDLSGLYHQAEYVSHKLHKNHGKGERLNLCSSLRAIDKAVRHKDCHAKTFEHKSCIPLRKLNHMQKYKMHEMTGSLKHGSMEGLSYMDRSQLRKGLKLSQKTHKMTSFKGATGLRHKESSTRCPCLQSQKRKKLDQKEKRNREMFLEEKLLKRQLKKGLLTETQRKDMKRRLEDVKRRRRLEGLLRKRIMMNHFEKKLIHLKHQQHELKRMQNSVASTPEMKALINRYLARLSIKIKHVKQRAVYERQQAEILLALMDPNTSPMMSLALKAQLKEIRKQIKKANKQGLMMAGISRKRWQVKQQIKEINTMLRSKVIYKKVRKLLKQHLKHLKKKLEILDKQHHIEKEMRDVRNALEGHVTPIMREALNIKMNLLRQHMTKMIRKSHPISPYDHRAAGMRRQLKEYYKLLMSPVMNEKMRRVIRAQIKGTEQQINQLMRQKAVKRQIKELRGILASDDLQQEMRRDLKRQLRRLDEELSSLERGSAKGPAKDLAKGSAKGPAKVTMKAEKAVQKAVKKAVKKAKKAIKKTRKRVKKTISKTQKKVEKAMKKMGKGSKVSKKPQKSIKAKDQHGIGNALFDQHSAPKPHSYPHHHHHHPKSQKAKPHKQEHPQDVWKSFEQMMKSPH